MLVKGDKASEVIIIQPSNKPMKKNQSLGNLNTSDLVSNLTSQLKKVSTYFKIKLKQIT